MAQPALYRNSNMYTIFVSSADGCYWKKEFTTRSLLVPSTDGYRTHYSREYFIFFISQAVLLGHQDTVPLLRVAAGVRGRLGLRRRVRVVVAVLVEVPGPLQGHKVISGSGQRSHALLATCLAGRNCLWTLYSALASHYYPTQQSIGLSECFWHCDSNRQRDLWRKDGETDLHAHATLFRSAECVWHTRPSGKWRGRDHIDLIREYVQ